MNRVLLLEDNPADARLMKEAFAELAVEAELDHVASARDAQEYIEECLNSGRAPPDLFVLDIQLPTESGIDVLRHIRNLNALRDIPVIMLTTSDRDDDIAAAKAGGASTYYIKPPDLAGFLELVEELRSFWIGRPGIH